MAKKKGRYPIKVSGKELDELGKRIGKNIIHFRESEGLSISEVAKKLGVSVHTVAAWEYGRNIPKIPNLVALSKLLKVSIDRLFVARK